MKRKQNKKRSPKAIPPGHKLVSRRDFIAHGLVAAGGSIALPTLTSLFSSEAMAAGGCQTLSGHTMVPFLVFDCAGGIGLSGSWLGLDENGNLFDDREVYKRMAVLDPNNHTTEFGTPLVRAHGDASNGFCGFHDALTNPNLISPEARSKFQVGSMAARSTNDTSLNQLHPGLLCLQATMEAGKGRLFGGGFGNVRSRSGGRQKSPDVNEVHQFFGATSRTDFTEGLSYGLIQNHLNQNERNIAARFIKRLSSSQLASLGNLAFRDQFQAVLGCALDRNLDRTSVNPELDPMNDSDCVDVFKLNQGTLAGSNMSKARRELVATIVFNTLMKNCAGGSITFGGCDYHNNEMPGTGAHGDRKDLEVGAALALAVELAHRKGIPLFVAVISDGSTGCNDNAYGLSERRWTSDSSANGMALACLYQPSGAVNLVRKQIGHYKVTTRTNKPPVVGADPATIVGNNSSNVAHSLFANYLASNTGNVESAFERHVDPLRFNINLIQNILLIPPKT